MQSWASNSRHVQDSGFSYHPKSILYKFYHDLCIIVLQCKMLHSTLNHFIFKNLRTTWSNKTTSLYSTDLIKDHASHNSIDSSLYILECHLMFQVIWNVPFLLSVHSKSQLCDKVSELALWVALIQLYLPDILAYLHRADFDLLASSWQFAPLHPAKEAKHVSVIKLVTLIHVYKTFFKIPV